MLPFLLEQQIRGFLETLETRDTGCRTLEHIETRGDGRKGRRTLELGTLETREVGDGVPVCLAKQMREVDGTRGILSNWMHTL